MVHHSVYGVVVACSEPLGLPETDPSRAPWLTIELLGAQAPELIRDWSWELATPSGERFLAVRRQGHGLRLRFEQLADVVIDEDGARARLWPNPGVSAAAVRHLLLDQLLPRVLARRGHSVLHASAVLGRRGALAFLGPSGVGKSTLAAKLAASGAPVMADDALVIEAKDDIWHARPAYPGLRLSLPGAGAKGRVCKGIPFAAAPAPLAAIYQLERPSSAASVEAPRVVPLAGVEALTVLVRESYRLDVSDRDELRSGFEQLSALAAGVPMFRLLLPNDEARLVDVVDLLDS